jgi:chromosome segregation ATPase
MTAGERELIAFVEKAIDLGDPEQIKLYDDIMADTDRPSRLTKIGLFLMKHGTHGSPTNSESSRLIHHIEHLLAVLQAFVSRPDLLGDVLSETPPWFSPIPREFFQAQAERLRDLGRAIDLDDEKVNSLSRAAIRLSHLKKLKIQIESIDDVEQLRSLCYEFRCLFEFTCFLNDILIRRNPKTDQKQILLTSRLKIQSDQMSALKAENSQLLTRLQENDDEFANLGRNIAKLKVGFQETETVSKRLAASKADRARLSAQLHEIEANCAQLRQEKCQLLRRLQDIEGELDNCQLESASAKDVKRHLERQIETLIKRFKETEIEKVKELANVRQNDGDLARLTEENTSLKEQLQLANAKLKAQSQEKEENVRRLDSLAAKLERIKSRSDSPALDADLRMKNDQLEVQLLRLRSEIGKHMQMRDEHMEEISFLKKKISEAESAISTSLAENQQLQAKLQKVMKEASFHKQVASEYEERGAKVMSMAEQVSSILSDVENQRQTLSTVTRENKRLSKTSADQQELIESLRKEQQAIAAQNEQLHTIIEQQRAAASDVERFSRERELIQSDLQRANQTIEELGDKLAELTRICKKSQSKCSSLKERCNWLEAGTGFSELKTEFLLLQKSHDDLRKRNAILVDENGRLRDDQELFVSFRKCLAKAIGESVHGRQPNLEMSSIIERIRSDHMRMIALEQYRQEHVSFPLAKIDELDREIDSLRRNLLLRS